RNSGVIRSVVRSKGGSVFPSVSIRLIWHKSLHLSIHFHPITEEEGSGHSGVSGKPVYWEPHVEVSNDLYHKTRPEVSCAAASTMILIEEVLQRQGSEAAMTEVQFRRGDNRDHASTRKLVDHAFGSQGSDVAAFLDALRADGCILGEWLAEDFSGP